MNRKRTDHFWTNEGFTLIEAAIALAVICLLAWAVVPRYMELRNEARKEAVASATAELEARVLEHFTAQIIAGKTAGAVCYDTVDLDISLCGRLTVEDWDASDNCTINCTVTYHPDPKHWTKHTVSERIVISKPLFEDKMPQHL